MQIMHYLETLRPQQLLEQMVCTAFRACADVLNQTSYGGFGLMKTKMDQLYLTLGSSLKSLQGIFIFSIDAYLVVYLFVRTFLTILVCITGFVGARVEQSSYEILTQLSHRKTT
jgi:hypothetical protein